MGLYLPKRYVMVKLVTKLLIGLTLGIIPTIWIIQNDRYVKQLTLQPIIKHLEKKWNAKITINHTHVNLFTGIIYLDHLTITSKGPVGCTWLCNHGKLHIQQQSSFLDKRINLHIELNENTIKTEYKNQTLGLSQLLRSIFLFQSNQVNAQSFLINDINLSISNNSYKPKLSLEGSLQIKKDKNHHWHGRLLSKNCSVMLYDKPFITNLTGITQFHQPRTSSSPLQTKIAHSFRCPFFNDRDTYTIAGNWGVKTEAISLKNEHETCSFFITPTTNGLIATANLKLDQLSNWKGECNLQTSISQTITGSLAINNLQRNTILFNKLALTFSHKTGLIDTNFDLIYEGGGMILTGNAQLNLATMAGSYKTKFVHKQTKKKIPFTGTFCVKMPQIITSGTSPYGSYFAAINPQKKLPLTKLLVQKNGIIVARFNQNEQPENSLAGTIEYKFLQSLFPTHLRKWALGNKGLVTIFLTRHDHNHLAGKLSFVDGKIHIPDTYNLITSFSANFDCDIMAKKLLVQDIIVGLYKGSITCDQATIYWDNQMVPSFIHAYFQAKDLLLNWKNDFFGFINGTFFVTKKQRDNPMHVLGDIIIKKSLFKESVFSGKTSANIIQNSILPLMQKDEIIYFDLHIFNEQNLTINTPFLQTQATANLNIKLHALRNTLSAPLIHGNITLRRGMLTFPKNNLFISSGKIDFIPTQINNPMVSLLAKNRIKKYLISLQVSGPLQQPTILLESNPHLPEEQIIALLFAGSETMNLKTNLPVILMQNMHKLIFGDQESLPPAQKFFKTLTTPLKYIQITPNFTNQSGRGGVRGTLSIDINKQLHAQIQKNFTMQDDLSFQLEYFLSDDFNIKAIKDAREDIGIELEMVYKP